MGQRQAPRSRKVMASFVIRWGWGGGGVENERRSVCLSPRQPAVCRSACRAIERRRCRIMSRRYGGVAAVPLLHFVGAEKQMSRVPQQRVLEWWLLSFPDGAHGLLSQPAPLISDTDAPKTQSGQQPAVTIQSRRLREAPPLARS